MHSRRMCTTRSLTISRSIQWRGGGARVCPTTLIYEDPPGCRPPLEADLLDTNPSSPCRPLLNADSPGWRPPWTQTPPLWMQTHVLDADPLDADTPPLGVRHPLPFARVTTPWDSIEPILNGTNNSHVDGGCKRNLFWETYYLTQNNLGSGDCGI